MGQSTFYVCRNATNGNLVGQSIRKADNVFSRLVGLLNRSSLNDGEGLWITPCNSIHSIGMQFKFDAIFMDSDGRVLHMIEAMPSLRLSRIIWKAHSVLELPEGSAKRCQIHVDDVLSFEASP